MLSDYIISEDVLYIRLTFITERKRLIIKNDKIAKKAEFMGRYIFLSLHDFEQLLNAEQFEVEEIE